MTVQFEMTGEENLKRIPEELLSMTVQFVNVGEEERQ